VAFALERHRDELQAKGTRCRLDAWQANLKSEIIWVQQDSDGSNSRNQLIQQFQPLRTKVAAAKERHARKIALRSVETGDQTHFYRIVTDDEHDRDGRAGGLSRLHRIAAANDHRHLAADQIGGEARQLIPLIVRPSLLDNDVASFYKPFLAQAVAERRHNMLERRGCRAPE
jgi:hypothetical protein